MPLSFAALLGGMTTLIGTSTNLLAAGVAQKSGGLTIGFFDFTVPAGAMALVGFAYVAFVLPRILKARAGMAEQMTGGSGKQFIAQIEISYGHPLAGVSAVVGHVPGPQGHDRPPRPARRASLPAAVREPDAAARRHRSSSPPPARR